jgi:hypothetical protein
MFELSLLEVADEVEREGGDGAPLRALADEAAALERPPGALARTLAGLREAAARQWERLLGELQESREAAALVQAAVRGDRSLSADERDRVRAQLADLVKAFPAGLIAAVGMVSPLPGSAIATPWLLDKLGLMPSRWREAHLLEQVRRREAALRAEGRGAAADRVAALQAALVRESEAREQLPRPERGPGELEYARELARLRGLAGPEATRRAWFVAFAGQVYGPCRLREIDATMDELLVCWRGESRWVLLRELLPAS